MARKESGTILQEELYPDADVAPETPREQSRKSRRDARMDDDRSTPRVELDDARLVDLDADEESPFLRGQKRVSARRSTLPKKTAHRLLWAGAAVAALGILTIAAAVLYNYGEHSWRFRINSSDNIEVTGNENVTKSQIMEVMGADIGRNIFFVPLSQQQAQLEQIPWIESASVMRFVPNRLQVEIHERTPVAFARVGPRILLIDAGGTLMDLPKSSHGRKYSFPVILGMNPGEPLSTRAPRMQAYDELVHELDSGGARYSQDLSEVDLSDLDNLKVRVNDPAGDVLVELGSTDYLKRYQTYISHAQDWRRQFQKLESVNLRYDNQVIVNPEIEGRSPATSLSAKSAASAPLKPAALITKTAVNPKGVPKPAFELSKSTLDAAAGKKSVAKTKPKKTTVQHSRTGAAKKKAKPAAGGKSPAAGGQVGSGQTNPGASPISSSAGAKPSPAIGKPSAGSSPN